MNKKKRKKNVPHVLYPFGDLNGPNTEDHPVSCEHFAGNGRTAGGNMPPLGRDGLGLGGKGGARKGARGAGRAGKTQDHNLKRKHSVPLANLLEPRHHLLIFHTPSIPALVQGSRR